MDVLVTQRGKMQACVADRDLQNIGQHGVTAVAVRLITHVSGGRISVSIPSMPLPQLE